MKSLLLAFVFLFLINGCESKDGGAIDLEKGKKTYKQGNEAALKNDYILAFKYYKESCEKDYASGCSNIADAYKFGNDYILGREAGISVDKELSDKYYKKSADLYMEECKLDNANSCSSLAGFYKEGKILDKNLKLSKEFYIKSTDLYLKECDLDNANSCEALSYLYEKGYGYQKNQILAEKFYDKYIKIYTKSCSNGDIKKCESLLSTVKYRSKHMSSSSIDIKFVTNKILSHYLNDCNKNNVKSCSHIAYLYKNNKEIENQAKALEFYKRACTLKDGESCFSVYFLYHAIKSHKSEERKFLEKSCDNNYATGCSQLAVLTSSFNPMQSLNFYKKACNLGEGVSCYTVGGIYYSKFNETEANKFYKKGCDLKNKFSCKEYEEKKEDCTDIKKKFLSCVHRSSQGLECLSGTDIVLPAKCK